MLPNSSRGFSFGGVTAYLTHDKRAVLTDGTPLETDSAERVGFCRLMNFEDGEARTPAEAAKVMALVVRDADRIKIDAGIRPTGNKPERETVFHLSLSWDPTERVTEAEMTRAMGEALAASGLGLDKGYQTYCVEHIDTGHQHLHAVVNLVHPLTGKQANPHGDYAKLQKWARGYEKQRGQVFCHDREAKYAAIDRERASHAMPIRAAFNGKAEGETGKPKTSRAGGGSAPGARPPRPVPYHVWQAQQQARDAAEHSAAARVKADLGDRYRALREQHEAGFRARQREAAEARADAKGGRDAIYGKYASALDAIYKPQAGPKTASPERGAWAKVHQALATREALFLRREGGTIGQIINAFELTRGRNRGNILRVLFDTGERRRLFDQQQRRTMAKLAPPRSAPGPKAAPQPKTPDLNRVRAGQVKAMRTAELAAFTRDQAAKAASMEARHQFQQEAEQAQRARLKADSRAAWQKHREAFPPQAKEQDNRPAEAEKKPDQFGRGRDRQPRPPRTGAAPETVMQAAPVTIAAPDVTPDATPEAKPDRYGRSRDRKPRQPRQAKGQTAANTDASPENSPVEAVEAFDRVTAPAAPEATHGADLGQGGAVPAAPASSPADERAARIAARIAELQAEQAGRGQDSSRDNDPGRTMGR